MKNKKSCLLILLLIVSMVLSACGTSNSEPKDNESDKNTATQDSEAMTPLGKYPEMVTINVAKTIAANPNLVDGQTPEDNILLDWIRNELNIDVKVAWQAEGSEYNNKLSLNIAAGALPDMFIIPAENYLTFRQMVDNDLLADLTDIYDKCAGEYMKSTYESYNGKNLEPLTIDGKLRAISSASLGYGHNILWLRKDWMDKLGLEEPKSIEDLQHVLKEFIEKDPGNNGAGNTVGLALSAVKPVGGYANQYGAEPIFHSLGAYPAQWMQDENGKIYYGSTAPEVKEGLKVLRDMYSEGLIDKQFLTRLGTGETEALLTSGLSGAYFGPWWSVPGDIIKTDPNAEFIPVNAPLDANGKFNHLNPSPTGDLLAINKNFKNPEALLKIVNLSFDMYRGFNVEGNKAIQPLIDKGISRVALFPTGNFNIDYYDVVPKLGKLTKGLIETGELHEDETTSDYDRAQAQYAKDYVDGVNKDKNHFKAYERRYLSSNILDTPENNPVDAAYCYTTESSARLKPTLDKLEDQMFLQIIIGEKPLDYFDEFVEQWYKLGGDVLTKEVEDILK
ncbi:extracellular solute-binding protein [Vallitalea guaymasensis]|uniref:extracellular solute-binding protein n=1 Tax=Vallitalea guaymasensis TaxID=1185412 RepID=UPI00187D658F|nr:extracellular solute-binding protein [Vallitalea guaymasensis]